jgi:uncharacterized protein YqkB
MELKFTDEAIKILSKKIGHKTGVFRLDYDIEGCGCVNDGVTHLVFISFPTDGDEELSANFYKCFIPKQYMIFFDEHLIIDYSNTYKMFQLKSSVRMINPRMSFRDNV